MKQTESDIKQKELDAIREKEEEEKYLAQLATEREHESRKKAAEDEKRKKMVDESQRALDEQLRLKRLEEERDKERVCLAIYAIELPVETVRID